MELSGLEEAVAEVGRKVDHYAKRLKNRPLLERRNKIEGRLRELPKVDVFPEGGVERLDLLLKQRRALIDERTKSQTEVESHRFRRAQIRIHPEECSRRARIIESLRTLVPRVDAARRIYTAGLERREAVRQEKSVLRGALANVIAPSGLAFGLFISIIWTGVIGLVLAGQEYWGASLATASVLVMIWYRSRLKRTAALEQQVTACSLRLKACESELRKTEREAREIESEIRKITGQGEIAQADIDERVTELNRLLKLNDEVRNLDEAVARGEAELLRIQQQMEEVDTNIAALLAAASAASEPEFLERAEIYKQRRYLSGELEKIPVEIPEPGMLFDMRADEEAALKAAETELAELQQRLSDARHETGRVEERIAIMEKNEERSRSLLRQETILARIDEAAEQWAVITLCRTLLDETRKIYETERQPEVLRQASSFFAVMTKGRYARVIAPLDGGEIQVERADGARLAPQLLSRGAAEQLYLSMRMALIREYANHVEPLPVVFDDIFVNFDPARSRTSFKALGELCATHQVLLFTCHPHLVKQIQETRPEVKVFSLA